MRLYQGGKLTDRKRMTKREIVSIFYKHLSFLFSTSLSLCGKFGSPLPGKTHSSRKNSATHSYQCVQYFRGDVEWLISRLALRASRWQLCRGICLLPPSRPTALYWFNCHSEKQRVLNTPRSGCYMAGAT